MKHRREMRTLSPEETLEITRDWSLQHGTALFTGTFEIAGKTRMWRQKDGRWTVRIVYRNQDPKGFVSSIVHTLSGITLE